MKIILCMVLLIFSLKATAQQNTSTYFVSVPQIGSDASFLVLEKNINSLNNLQDFDRSIDNYNLSINQLGVNNVVEVKNGVSDIQLIGQKGRDNYYNFIDYYNNSPTKMNILQEGNANSLHIYGTNSLMEHVKIIQKANYKAITIRNY